MIQKEINNSKQIVLEQETKKKVIKIKIRKIKQTRGEIQEFKLFLQEREKSRKMVSAWSIGTGKRGKNHFIFFFL